MWPGGVHEGSSRFCSDRPPCAHSSLHSTTCGGYARGSGAPDRRLPRCRGVEHRQRCRHHEAAAGLARRTGVVPRRRTPWLSLCRHERACRTTPGSTPWPNRRRRASSRSQPDDPAALLLRGHVLHQLHRFGEAEVDRPAPRDAARVRARLSGCSATSLMEQGRVTEAADAYQKMIDLKPFYQSYTRAAHLRWLKGDLDGAIEMMHAAVKAASPRDPESVAWAYSRLADVRAPARSAGRRGAHDRRVAAVRARLRRGAARARPHPARAEEARRRGRDAGARGAPQSAARIPVGAGRRAALAEPRPTKPRRSKSSWCATAARRSAHARALSRRRGARTAAGRSSSPDASWRSARDVFTLDALAWALASAGAVRRSVVAHGPGARRRHRGRPPVPPRRGDRRRRRPSRRRRALGSARRAALRFTLLPSELGVLRTGIVTPPRA